MSNGHASMHAPNGRESMTMTAFSRTFARLLADHHRVALLLMVGGGLVLTAWGWWATHAKVMIYDGSDAARIELDASTFPVQAPLLGRIVSANLHVGQAVRQGDVLIEIDAAPQDLQRRQQQVTALGRDREADHLRSELAAEEGARAEEQRAAGVRADEATSRIQEAEADARYAESDLARAEQLHGQQLLSDRELEKARADAQRL